MPENSGKQVENHFDHSAALGLDVDLSGTDV